MFGDFEINTALTQSEIFIDLILYIDLDYS